MLCIRPANPATMGRHRHKTPEAPGTGTFTAPRGKLQTLY